MIINFISFGVDIYVYSIKLFSCIKILFLWIDSVDIFLVFNWLIKEFIV